MQAFFLATRFTSSSPLDMGTLALGTLDPLGIAIGIVRPQGCVLDGMGFVTSSFEVHEHHPLASHYQHHDLCPWFKRLLPTTCQLVRFEG